MMCSREVGKWAREGKEAVKEKQQSRTQLNAILPKEKEIRITHQLPSLLQPAAIHRDGDSLSLPAYFSVIHKKPSGDRLQCLQEVAIGPYRILNA
jgi:hypothetical protein